MSLTLKFLHTEFEMNCIYIFLRKRLFVNVLLVLLNLQQRSSNPTLYSDHDFVCNLDKATNLTMIWNMEYSCLERKLHVSIRKHDSREWGKKEEKGGRIE